MSNNIDDEFVNEQIRVLDQNLGYASASAGLDRGALQVFDKFLDPSAGPLPDIDTDYVDPWRDFLQGREGIDTL